MGDKDKALDYLRRSLTSRDDAIYNDMMIDPDLENIRETEGFRQILENALSYELNAPKKPAAPAFSSDYIRGYISGNNNCKSVVLSNAGTIAFSGGNITWNRIPDALVTKIREYSNIIDIVLKSDGSWLILYDTRKYVIAAMFWLHCSIGSIAGAKKARTYSSLRIGTAKEIGLQSLTNTIGVRVNSRWRRLMPT